MLNPHVGKVYDPCCGSGGMFVQSEKFIAAHVGRTVDVAIFCQEANPTTWRLAAMNLAIRGIDFNLGREPGDTHNQHPDLRADFILANGSMSSSQNSEGTIRAAMVDADVVEVMIALPGQLFFNTQIPACLWFLVKKKTHRQGEVLFIDARKQASWASRWPRVPSWTS